MYDALSGKMMRGESFHHMEMIKGGMHHVFVLEHQLRKRKPLHAGFVFLHAAVFPEGRSLEFGHWQQA